LLIFDSTFNLIGIKATTRLLIAVMFLLFNTHEVFLGNQDVGTLLLLIVELLYELTVGLIKVFFLLWVEMMSAFSPKASIILVSTLVVVSMGI